MSWQKEENRGHQTTIPLERFSDKPFLNCPLNPHESINNNNSIHNNTEHPSFSTETPLSSSLSYSQPFKRQFRIEHSYINASYDPQLYSHSSFTPLNLYLENEEDEDEEKAETKEEEYKMKTNNNNNN